MSTWKDIVKGIAPVLGTALGGPFGGAASKFIAEKFLGNPDADQEDIEEFILGASPEQLVNLKQIDKDFKLQMKALNIDVYKLDIGDRDSARKLFNINVWPQITLSAIFILGYFTILIYLLTHPDTLSSENQAMLGVFTTILGVLTAAVPQILNFWFGSSLGSKEKTHKLKGK